MSKLQEETKPILTTLIEDDWRGLSQDVQQTLAAWAAMFVSVYEMADPPTAIIPAHHRGFLMYHSLVPPDWVVWIGRHDPEGRHPAYANHHAIKMLGGIDRLPKIIDVQFTGFTVGKLLIQTAMITPAVDDPNLSINGSDFSAHFDLRIIAPFQKVITDKPKVAHNRISRDRVSNNGAQCLGIPTHDLKYSPDK